MSELTPDQRLINEELTVPFAGLNPDDTDAVEIPNRVARKLDIGANTDSLKEVLDLLPSADSGDLRSANRFVNDDGSLDTEQLKSVDGIDIGAAADALDIDPDAISDATRYERVPGHQEVVDKRREALSALGYNVKYQWQIASGKYAIINPDHAYQPGLDTLANFNEEDDVFGWLSFRDYGGIVDLYILFTDECVQTPDDIDYDIYLGYHTGYDFEGQRRLFLNHFGYYPKGEGRGSYLYGIGTSHKRKHVGDPTNPVHERNNDRLPIEQWWNESHKEFLQDDTLVTEVTDAQQITADFEDEPFDLYGFYRLLDIPPSQAESAVSRVEVQTNGRLPTMWDIGIGLVFTLASEFSGHKSGAVFRARSRTATDIIRNPDRVISRVYREYQESGLPDDDTDDTSTDTSADTTSNLDILISEIESPDDLAELDSFNVGDLSAEEKGTLVETTEQVLINNF
jgi:hypothetical protein